MCTYLPKSEWECLVIFKQNLLNGDNLYHTLWIHAKFRDRDPFLRSQVYKEFEKKEWFYFLNFWYIYIYFIIPLGKFRPPYLGKATAGARAAPPSTTSACWGLFMFPLTWTTGSLACVCIILMHANEKQLSISSSCCCF